MVHLTSKELIPAPDARKLLTILSGIVLLVMSLTILQDFLETKRGGYTFHFSESLLFKIVWLLYIPMTLILHQKLKGRKNRNTMETIALIAFAIIIHLLMLSCVGSVLTTLFYQGQYGFFKFFSYTLTHDLHTLLFIYTGLVLGHQYLFKRKQDGINVRNESKPASHTMIINNGKDNVIVNVRDILQITSATPYVWIHLENKRFLHSETLKSLHGKLEEGLFIRVHKSTLINLSKVNSFKSRLNGDYDLQMIDGSIVRLSRTYTADFKRHFHKRSSGQDMNSSG